LILAVVALASLMIVAPAPAETWNYYQVSCNSTTGSPYVSHSAVSFSPLQASLNCYKGLVSKRWGISICGNVYHSYYSYGWYYGVAHIVPNTAYCNYSRGSSFSTRAFVTGAWN